MKWTPSKAQQFLESKGANFREEHTESVYDGNVFKVTRIFVLINKGTLSLRAAGAFDYFIKELGFIPQVTDTQLILISKPLRSQI